MTAGSDVTSSDRTGPTLTTSRSSGCLRRVTGAAWGSARWSPPSVCPPRPPPSHPTPPATWPAGAKLSVSLSPSTVGAEWWWTLQPLTRSTRNVYGLPRSPCWLTQTARRCTRALASPSCRRWSVPAGWREGGTPARGTVGGRWSARRTLTMVNHII